MLIFEAGNIVLQVHVIKNRCWDFQYLPFLQTFSYALFRLYTFCFSLTGAIDPAFIFLLLSFFW